MRHFKPHTLSEPEEKIINIKNVTGANALDTLYDSITNRYTFKLEVDGETEGTDARRADGLRPPARPGPARRGPTRNCTASTGRMARSWGRSTRRWCATGATSRSDPAQFRQPDRGPQPGQRHPRRGGQTPCWRCAGATPASSSASSGSRRAGWAWNACAATTSTRRWPNPTRPMPSIRPPEMVLDSFHQFDPRVGELAQAGLRPGPPRQRSAQGQAGRRLLLPAAARTDPLGAAQLPGPGR